MAATYDTIYMFTRVFAVLSKTFRCIEYSDISKVLFLRLKRGLGDRIRTIRCRALHRNRAFLSRPHSARFAFIPSQRLFLRDHTRTRNIAVSDPQPGRDGAGAVRVFPYEVFALRPSALGTGEERPSRVGPRGSDRAVSRPAAALAERRRAAQGASRDGG